jgi:hypothetical protein
MKNVKTMHMYEEIKECASILSFGYYVKYNKGNKRKIN